VTRTPTRDRFAPGSRIGDYIVRAELQNEDMGVVYEAVHLVLPRRAALKVMHQSNVWLKSLAVQMLREACILEALSHPGAPRVYECGVLPDKRPWVALELIDGRTLAQEMAEGAIAPADMIQILRTIGDVLAHAHARGVVHHHISERVIVRTPDRAVPVCLRGWSEVGTQDSSRDIDPATDILALGAVAYRALTGAVLVPHDSAAWLSASPDAALAQLLADMLSPDPVLRPTAAEVRGRASKITSEPKPKWLAPKRLTTVNDDADVRVRIKR
jgi:serine/threonine protein kinase